MPIIATVSATQVTEAIKILVGDTDSLHRSLMQFDVWANDRPAIKLGEPNPDCKTCGQRIYEFLDAEAHGIRRRSLRPQRRPDRPALKTSHVDLKRTCGQTHEHSYVKQNEYLVRFSRGNDRV